MTGGILVIDKPSGPTSFEVVQRVRRLLRAEKAGHAGTLDPLATGVLAVCVGDAVKLQQFLSDCDKAYEALAAFGAATDTEDAEGTVVARGEVAGLTPEAIAASLPRFVGAIEQVPPMYSAVRIGGRRLHDAARAGEQVDRAPRRVHVHALTLRGVDPLAGGLLGARIEVRCGKGTYVRTLVADLGRALGVPAHLAALRRTAAGPFSIGQAIPLDEAERLGRANRDALRARLLPPESALGHLPAVRLSPTQARDVAHGRALAMTGPAEGLCQALDEAGHLLAVCASARGALRPVRVFVPSAGPPLPGAGDER